MGNVSIEGIAKAGPVIVPGIVKDVAEFNFDNWADNLLTDLANAAPIMHSEIIADRLALAFEAGVTTAVKAFHNDSA
jgi:hypothetical protein